MKHIFLILLRYEIRIFAIINQSFLFIALLYLSFLQSEFASPSIGNRLVLQPSSNNLIDFLRLLPQSPVRGVNLLQGQSRELLRHRLAQLRRQGLIPQRLDKQCRDPNLPIENSELIFVVHVTGAIPVNYKAN